MEHRFWHKVPRRPDVGCWLWEGAITKGHGRFKMDGRVMWAHRVAWQLFKQDKIIPPGHQIRHSCGQSLCVRPSHLYAGRGPHIYVKRHYLNKRWQGAVDDQELVWLGERFRGVRLTPAAVRRIRRMVSRGGRQVDIARALRVSRSCISRIINQKRRKENCAVPFDAAPPDVV